MVRFAAALIPELAQVLAGDDAADYERTMRGSLLAGRRLRGARRQRVAAALGLALSFTTWQHLVRREQLDDDATVVEILTRAVASAG